MPLMLDQIIAPNFAIVHEEMQRGSYTSFWLKGGRGSTKSSFAALEIVMGIVADPEANAVCFRKVAGTIKDSLMPNFIWAIEVLGWGMFFRVNKSDEEVTYLPTGQKILMRGLDDPKKMKSIKAKKGYFKFLWFEEGSEYTDIEEMESVTQSVLRGGDRFVEIVTYNPPAEPMAWINEEARRHKPTRLVHESNYLQINPAWLGPKFLSDAAEMKASRPEKYAHIYMGVEVGRTGAIIFSGCYRIETFQAEYNQQQRAWFINGSKVDGPYLGADWGFSQDPNVLVRVFLDMALRLLYIEYADYGYRVLLDKIPAQFDKVPDSRRYKIRADCARPETIAHVKSHGFDVEAAEKWTGSEEDGIEFIKSFTMVIHPRCTELLEEALKYCYKTDRHTRNILPDIIDKWNHGWDATRYALAPLIKPKPKGIFGSGVLGQRQK